VIIIGSAMLLKFRTSRDQAPQALFPRTTSILMGQMLQQLRTSVFRQHRSHMSDVSSDPGIDCDNELESNFGPEARPKRTNPDAAIELPAWSSDASRKRMHSDLEL
jgi:hypothetical protein